MNAQVSFLDSELSLIHIPLELYYAFIRPILQTLLPQAHSLSRAEDDPDPSPLEGLGERYVHTFFNLSITPIECSIVCHTYWSKHVFEPALRAGGLAPDAVAAVSIARESYIALCVVSAGLDAGSRVVDISSPLALAGIPLFFITTYYSDFILVPSRDRQNVLQALRDRGFDFSELDSTLVAPGSLSHPNAQAQHVRRPSTTKGTGTGMDASVASVASLASLPLGAESPSNQDELQERTFDLLRERHVMPYIVPGLALAYCSGNSTGFGDGMLGARSNFGSGYGGYGRGSQRRGTRHQRDSWVDSVDTRFYTCLVSALALPPRFLSITLAAPDPPSVLLDKTLLPLFGNSLVGDMTDELVPIFLDLVTLPFNATGIVSGVAGKLVAAMNRAELPDLSYLSTSKAGAVILSRENAQTALQILEPLLGTTVEKAI